MTTSDKVLHRWASKRQQDVIKVLQKGGYLERWEGTRGKFYSVMDGAGNPAMDPIPMTTWASLLRGKVLIQDTRNGERYILDPQWGVKKPRRTGMPEGTVGYIIEEVLAGAYSANSWERAALSHAVWADERANSLGDRTVCNKLNQNSLAWGAATPSSKLTCKVCAARVHKSGLPRLK
jgi:hypothetical protein